eukprot:m.480736 g.480736  ORF g.480736 m.480736 type:complete len:590 (+) comp21937_c0_seq1:170-1939(+)
MALSAEEAARQAAEAAEKVLFCVECEDQEASIRCDDCDEPFCRPCWAMQHHRGRRARHSTSLIGELMPQPLAPSGSGADGGSGSGASGGGEGGGESGSAAGAPSASAAAAPEQSEAARVVIQGRMTAVKEAYTELYEFIPMRLTEQERGFLKVLEGVLEVSEYTDKVDVYSYNKRRVILEQLAEVFETLLAVVTTFDFKLGIGFAEVDLEDMDQHKSFLRHIFEVGRRHKIMNPDKMRNTYGKLMYIMQDAADRDAERDFGFSVQRHINTVTRFLTERSSLAILEDELLTKATQDPSLFSAQVAARVVADKRKATEVLCEKYASEDLSVDDIHHVISSIADSNCYQAQNAAPVLRMIHYLKSYYSPKQTSDERVSLRLRYGESGSKLSHSHSQQYTYVLQSLTLWRSISQQMFKLWMAADSDLQSDRGYRLQNTGQGLNRVQACPRVGRAMQEILGTVQREAGSWVGLSVVHLGDRDVPNALIFIDKYTQVARILRPIVSVLDNLEVMAEDEKVGKYIYQAFGSVDDLRYMIMTDFFKHAFNGDGDDGGSCIDGRLTSTWNWCSKLEKKPFYHVFLLAGFQGFDGSFKA